MKNPKPANFDRVAPVYDFLTLVFGGNIRRAQQYYLAKIPQNAHILIIGGGTGWILEDILLLKKKLRHITYLEASAKMLGLAKRKHKNFKSSHPEKHLPIIEWIKGTEKDIPPNHFYDVIITNFFLDLFEQTALFEVMKKLSSLLRQEGTWLFADFSIAEKTTDAWWQRILIKSMYLFFKITCNLQTNELPAIEQAFQLSGFKKVNSKSFFRNIIVSQVYRKTHYS